MTTHIESESNPYGMDILQGFAATRPEPKGYAKFLKIYKSVTNAPFKFDASNIADSLRILMLAQFETYAASITEKVEAEMWERSEDRGYFRTLIDGEQANLLIVAEKHVGTHTAKIPNPSVSGPGGLFANPEVFSAASKGTFVSSATFASRQSIGAAGNAAQGKAQRFLASKVRIGDQIVDVSVDIASKGVIFDAMLALGFTREFMDELSNILAGRLDGTIGDTTPGQFAKGLIWPTDEGDVVITPVHSYAMHVELAARIKERVSEGRRINWTHIVVGGTKPQNAGLVNSDMGGWHRLLKSYPPKVGSRSLRSAVRISKTGDISLNELSPSSPLVKEFEKIVKATYENNDATRTRLNEVICSMIRIAIIPLVEASHLGSALRGNEFRKLSPVVKDLLLKGFNRMDDQKEAVRIVVDAVTPRLSISKLDDGMRRLFNIAAEEILYSNFKGA
jgi:CRISPR-associated protein (Cas_Csy1).